MMKRKPVILLGLIFLLTLTLTLPELTLRATAAPPIGFKMIGYMPSWAGSVQAVQFDKLTHVNYAFMVPNSDGSVGSPPNVSKLNQLVSSAHANGVKVLMSMGGWNDGDDSAFEALAASASSRTRFVDSMVGLINTYNLDGIDIDWEYPDPGSSADNYALLMNQLSQAMHSRGKLLTAAVVGEGYVGGGVKNEVFGYVDFLNIMSYDGGTPHASYAYAVSNLDYWQGRGLPANKTVLGVPFYARPGEFTYRDAVAADPQNAYRDCATVNGVYGCYNGIPTIQDKTELALQRGTGVMFWELSQDTSDATSLVSAIYEAADTGVPSATNTPTTIPGTNLALNKPVASSSNETNDFTANLAVDGNISTRWSSVFSDPQWIYVDLGAAYSLNRVVLNWEAAYGQAYQIQVSNNATNWTTIFSTSSGDGGVDDLTVAGNGRYVRMYGTQRGTQWGYSLWEFAVYGTGSSVTPTPTNPPTNTPTPTHTTTPVPTNTNTPTTVPGANLALNKPAASSSNEDNTLTPDKAVDGSSTTRWASLEGSDPQWIYVDLGAVYSLNRVVLNWEAAYGQAYQIQVSNNATNWTTIFSTSSGDGGVDDLTVAGNGRYVRMYGTQRGTQWGYSLWEFAVYGTGSSVTPTPTNPPTNTPTPTHTATPVPTSTNTPTTIPGANLALNKPAASSSNEDNTLTPDKAVDGSSTTRWASLEGSDPQWIYVDLGAAYSLNRVVLNWEAAYGQAYQIQVSNNATNWTTIFSTSSGDGGVDDLTVAGNGRYVRMYGTQRGTQWGYSLWEFAVYGTGSSVTPTPTSTPVNTPVPTPTATPSASSNVLWAGVRSSPYGISPFPSPAGWTNAMTTMSSYFPGSTPVAVWLTGEIYFDGTNSGMDLNFPNPGGTYDSRLHFASTDRYESYLDYFDTHGIKVYLQVESGYAPIDDLIDANFRRYGHHPSVIGFGVDVEWYHSQCDGCANAPVGNALAQAWEATVKSYNPNYRLFLKHFDKADLPPTYRGDIVFIDDSEENGSYNNFLAEMGDFADFFYPADVMFQIGYASDQSWWSQLTAPIPQTLGQALADQTQQNCGIVWVDFTLRDVLPTN